MSSPENGSVPTLLEWAGGAPALHRMIDAFYDRVERDELLSPLFPGGVSQAHRTHVIAWWYQECGIAVGIVRPGSPRPDCPSSADVTTTP